MISVGDIVSISGLTSSRGILFNGGYGKVTTPRNRAGRYGVKPFTEICGPFRKMIPIPMGAIAPVLLKEVNITLLPDDNPESDHMRSYAESLNRKCTNDNSCDRYCDGSPEGLERMRDLQELYSLQGRAMFAPLICDLAYAEESAENYERALALWVDLYHSDIPREPFKLEDHLEIPKTLVRLNRPHAALSFLNSCTRTTYDTRYLFEIIINITLRLNDDPCGERAYKMLLEVSPDNPAVYLHFGKFYERKGDMMASFRMLQQAMECPSVNDDRDLQERIGCGLWRIRPLLLNPRTQNLTCTRHEEAPFDVNA